MTRATAKCQLSISNQQPTAKNTINGLISILIEGDLTAEHAAAIGAAIEFLQSSFFNEDASREIDRLILLVEQQAALIEQLEAGQEVVDDSIAS